MWRQRGQHNSVQGSYIFKFIITINEMKSILGVSEFPKLNNRNLSHSHFGHTHIFFNLLKNQNKIHDNDNFGTGFKILKSEFDPEKGQNQD